MSERKIDPRRPDTESYEVHISGPEPQPYEYPEGWRLILTLLGLAFGTFLMALDTTIITVAVPEIATEFKALDQVGWIGSAYLITLTAFQPIAGSCYKSFNPKYSFLVFMVIFEGGLKDGALHL
jgi:MFS family permease